MGVSHQPAQKAKTVLHQQKLTKAGQPAINSELCIATSRADGTPCLRACGEPGVPYCKAHMKSGDPSLKVAMHPFAGKILVAARDLPKGYRLALWGRCTSDTKISDKKMEWAFDLGSGWMLDPTGEKGSMVQYCPCAGPNEVAAVASSGSKRGKGNKFGSWAFVTKEALPAGWQVTMQYGNTPKESDTFFEERGIKRIDVGTTEYPALRRKDAEPVSAAQAAAGA
jgi:hypothetical protein